MENIFENAKFGDKFLTRDGRMAVFMGYNKRYGDNYLLVIPSLPEEECNIYADILNNANGSTCMNNFDYDIVSRYHEPIDEEKLDELAKESKKNISMFASAPHVLEMLTSYESGYKAGYRKAMEE